MKTQTLTLLLLLLLLVQTSFAQTGDFSRVKVYASPDQFYKMGQAGVALDHIHPVGKGSFIGEFSKWEIDRIKAAGGSLEYLIPDLKDYYRHQNDDYTPQKTAGVQSVPTNFNYGSMGGYLTHAEMIEELDSMVQLYPNLITMDSIGASLEGRAIWMMKISDNPVVDENEPEAFYNALHHAREPNSMMQLIYYMWYTLENYGTDSLVTYLVNEREQFFVPMVNPDGYIYNQTTDPLGGGFWRKNRRDNQDGSFGVDLNRNYGLGWGWDNFGSSPDPYSDVYRGPAAFSEPETQVMKTLCEAHDFKIAFNYHTFGNWLIYPWGYIPQRTPDSVRFIQLGEVLTRENGYIYGTGTETVGYTVNGDADDWMYGEQTSKNKIFSMTPEAGEQFYGFWPPISQIIPICEENLSANLHLACLAGECIVVNPLPEPPIVGTNYQLPADFHNLGLVDAQPVSASFISTDPNIVSVNNNPRNLGSLLSDQTVRDSFDLTLTSNIAEGTLITGIIETQYTGGYVQFDSVFFRYGSPVILFTSDGENPTNGDWQGGWQRTTEKAHSGVYSITDSPQFTYTPYDNNWMVTVNPMDLTGIVAPKLEFYATWDVEKNFDYVQIQLQADSAAFLPLEGAFTRPGTGFGVQPQGLPVYDGLRSDWVHEEISLAPWAGSPQVYLQFLLVSDYAFETDGYYFDDLVVSGYAPMTGRIEEVSQENGLFLYPNPTPSSPSAIQVRVGGATGVNRTQQLEIFTLQGKRILQQRVRPGTEIDLPNLASGLYPYRFVAEGEVSAWRKLLVR